MTFSTLPTCNISINKYEHLPNLTLHSNTITPPIHHLNPLQKAVAAALDLAEAAGVRREKNRHPLPKTLNPEFQLAGNFAPVPEHQVTGSLLADGKIPSCIDGVYVRNGANPLLPPMSGHHLFDGDGMIHAVRISGGAASYACRFTATNRLTHEWRLGRPVFPKPIGELHGHSGVARLLLFFVRRVFRLVDTTNGMGVANAGLIYFSGRLLAMSEDDVPYHVRVTCSGDLETVGRFDFNGQLKSAMIAHPKLDPETHELFALSYNIVLKPYLKFFKVSSNGRKSPDIEIPLNEPTMIHDFAITKNYVIIPDQQVIFNLGKMLSGGSPVIYDRNKLSRFGILSKNAKTTRDLIWVECPETFCFHLWNAWEEEENGEIVVIGSCMSPADAIFNEREEKIKSVLSEIRLNLVTGKSFRRPVIRDPADEVNLEGGMVNRTRLGRKTRFVYLAIVEPWPKVSGFAKVDLKSGKMKKFFYGNDRYGGEPFFLPRNEIAPSLAGDSVMVEEDDGHILVFVHDENGGKSELLIVDAANLTMQASVRLPSRVPYGFHGTFISFEELQRQL